MTTDPECIFCRIVRGEIPSARVYENEDVVAFRDIQPTAPVHILIVPRSHIASINSLRIADQAIAGALFIAARDIAASEGLADDGFRVVSNTGAWGGQTVDHLHLHLLGGRQLGALG